MYRIVYIVWMIGSVLTFVNAEKSDIPIKLDSYDIVILKLKKPAIVKDCEGREQTYDRAFLVTMKGSFPRHRATAMELFIGEFKVPQYGSTEEGLYFKLYNLKQVRGLEGKEFRYRYLTDDITSFRTTFYVKRFEPLKIVDEK